MTPVTRRPATARDAAFARDLHRAAYKDVVTRQFGAWDEERQHAFFLAEWGRGANEIILDGGVPCGWLRLQPAPGCISIGQLALLPGFQGTGTGTAVLREIQEAAAARGVPARLSVLRENRAAALYRRLGFADCGETPTHLLMEWQPPRDSPGIPQPEHPDIIPGRTQADRSREGEPLPALPGELRGHAARPHRHGPSSRPVCETLRACSCGEVGTYRYGTWRRAGWLTLWLHRRHVPDGQAW